MEVVDLPNGLISEAYSEKNDLQLFDYRATKDLVKSRVVLQKNVFSFLVKGQKKVNFLEESVLLSDDKFLLMASGNCLMSESHIEYHYYRSILLFFSHKSVNEFLLNHLQFSGFNKLTQPRKAYFLIEKDAYLFNFIDSLDYYLRTKHFISPSMLTVKFNEIMLYLVEKLGDDFVAFIAQLVESSNEISFRSVIEKNVYSRLNLDEMAFLCNMSLSTFKRHFQEVYKESPGRWLQTRRLNRAREILSMGEQKASDIFTDFGYENLSNFSAAFKQQFGVSPRQIHIMD